MFRVDVMLCVIIYTLYVIEFFGKLIYTFAHLVSEMHSFTNIYKNSLEKISTFVEDICGSISNFVKEHGLTYSYEIYFVLSRCNYFAMESGKVVCFKSATKMTTADYLCLATSATLACSVVIAGIVMNNAFTIFVILQYAH